MILVVLLIVALSIVAAVVGIVLFDPGHKSLKVKNRNLQIQVDTLNRQILEKDKELEALRLGLPWYATEKETDGTQE